MALNANYSFEELGEVKCSIIEKNCSAERVEFLKKLLEFNGFTVVVVNSPPPKTAAKPIVPAGTDAPVETTPPAPVITTFTVGVTDLTFNPINGVYNRQLKTEDGKFKTACAALIETPSLSINKSALNSWPTATVWLAGTTEKVAANVLDAVKRTAPIIKTHL